ncbi:MAG: hypothetical protein FWD68_12725 [Alphaproteobacteria bacterium]|nr:hypothetical protein [Alphaproteobacteria bacterium]
MKKSAGYSDVSLADWNARRGSWPAWRMDAVALWSRLRLVSAWADAALAIGGGAAAGNVAGN